jgi:hypothetical protein
MQLFTRTDTHVYRSIISSHGTVNLAKHVPFCITSSSVSNDVPALGVCCCDMYATSETGRRGSDDGLSEPNGFGVDVITEVGIAVPAGRLRGRRCR